jgi:hypothetical protein
MLNLRRKSRMRHRIRTATLLSLAFVAVAAQAANLVENPDFSDALEGWSVGPAGAISLKANDGLPSAPSLDLAASGTDVGSAVSSCIPIDDSVNVDFHAFVKGVTGLTAVGLFVYSDGACTTSIQTLSTQAFRVGNAWFPIGFNETELPAGTGSVQVFLAVAAGTGGTTAETLFDHVAFGRTGTLEDAIPIAQEGLTGTWYNPDRSGQGFEFVIDPGSNGGNASLFGAWFTYDTIAGGPNSQRWFSLQATFPPDTTTANVTIYQNLGGNFDAPPATSAIEVGRGSLTFFSCDSALFTYGFNAGLVGATVLRNLLPNVECGGTGTPPPTDYGLSGTWYDPNTSGQGIVAEVNPVNAQVFVGWYTYSLDQGSGGAGQQRWFSAQGAYDVGTASMDLTIYSSTNGTFDSDDTSVSTVPVGLATLTFVTCSTATLDYAFTDGEFAGQVDSIDLVRLGPALASCPLDP